MQNAIAKAEKVAEATKREETNTELSELENNDASNLAKDGNSLKDTEAKSN